MGWPDAGQELLRELRAGRDRYALIVADDPRDSDLVVERMSEDLDLSTVRVGAACADLDTPPGLRDIEAACGAAVILTDIELLFSPEIHVDVLAFLVGRARRLPTMAAWPGIVVGRRALYSAPGRPDHFDRSLSDVVLLRLRPTQFPDETPFEVERIAP